MDVVEGLGHSEGYTWEDLAYMHSHWAVDEGVAVARGLNSFFERCF